MEPGPANFLEADAQQGEEFIDLYDDVTKDNAPEYLLRYHLMMAGFWSHVFLHGEGVSQKSLQGLIDEIAEVAVDRANSFMEWKRRKDH